MSAGDDERAAGAWIADAELWGRRLLALALDRPGAWRIERSAASDADAFAARVMERGDEGTVAADLGWIDREELAVLPLAPPDRALVRVVGDDVVALASTRDAAALRRVFRLAERGGQRALLVVGEAMRVLTPDDVALAAARTGEVHLWSRGAGVVLRR